MCKMLRDSYKCQDMTKAELDLVALANLEANHKPRHESSGFYYYEPVTLALVL